MDLPIDIGEMDALLEQLEEEEYIIIDDLNTFNFLLKKDVIYKDKNEEFCFYKSKNFYSFRGEFIKYIMEKK